MVARDSNFEGSQVPDIQEILRLFGRALKLGFHTTLPGTVVKYTPAVPGVTPATVDVAPDIYAIWSKPDGTEEIKPLPVVPRCPVELPSGGDFGIGFDLRIGDPGRLSVTERSLERWIDEGAGFPPPLLHTHNLSDSIFTPGLRNAKNAIAMHQPGRMAIGRQDGTVVLDLGVADLVLEAPVIRHGAAASIPIARVGDGVAMPLVLAWIAQVQAILLSPTILAMWQPLGLPPPVPPVGPTEAIAAIAPTTPSTKNLAE